MLLLFWNLIIWHISFWQFEFSIKFYNDSVLYSFKIFEVTKSLILYVIESIPICHYSVIFNKMAITNIIFSYIVLLIVPLVFHRLKIKNNPLQHRRLEDALKRNYLNSSLYQLLRFLNFQNSLFEKTFFVIIWNLYWPFLNYAVSFWLIAAIYFYQWSLFWAFVDDIVNIFNVLLDLNPTNNFKGFLNFTCSFVDVNADVSFDEI